MTQFRCPACQRFLQLVERPEEPPRYFCPACSAALRGLTHQILKPPEERCKGAPTSDRKPQARPSNKPRHDRWLWLASPGVLLLMLAGAFWWFTGHLPGWVPAQPAVVDPEAQHSQQQEKEAKEREAMADFIRPWLPRVADSPVTDDPRILHRRDKVLIWDATKQAPSTANNLLPSAVRGRITDAELTLAVILHKRDLQVATYQFPSITGDGKKVPGFRTELDVGLLDGAEKKVLGRFLVTGDDPPVTIKRRVDGNLIFSKDAVDASPEYGDTDGPLARWLENRPRAGQPDPIREVRQKVMECRKIGKMAPRPLGKVLIWDVAKDVPSPANRRLPEALRGMLPDGGLTIVLIAGRKLLQQPLDELRVLELLERASAEETEENPSGVLHTLRDAKVFRESLELCLVSLPNKEALGTARVEGAFLIESSSKKDGWAIGSNVVGNSETEIARWIEGLSHPEGNQR
jgi:hypothetical protein